MLPQTGVWPDMATVESLLRGTVRWRKSVSGLAIMIQHTTTLYLGPTFMDTDLPELCARTTPHKS
jgi:hypothetical protein